MWITRYKSLRIICTMLLMSDVCFSHISCSKPKFRKSFIKDPSTMKIMTTTRKKGNISSPSSVRNNKMKVQVMNMLPQGLIHKSNNQQRRSCLFRRVNGDSGRKFFWPWSSWGSWGSWGSWLQPSRPMGFGILGGLNFPFLNVGGGFGASIGSENSRQEDRHIQKALDDPDYIGLTVAPPTPGESVGYERTAPRYYSQYHGQYKQPVPKYDYYQSGYNQYDYDDYHQRYPPDYGRYPAHYYPPNPIDSHNNDYTWYTRPGNNGYNRYSKYYQYYNDYNKPTNQYGKTDNQGSVNRGDTRFQDFGGANQNNADERPKVEKEPEDIGTEIDNDHDFYQESKQPSDEQDTQQDEHEFYYDEGISKKEANFWSDTN